jgi:chloramphenicol 3-O phosphotransferase
VARSGRRRDRRSSLNSSKIIFLNGASSAGKTTLAEVLQAELSEPFWHVSSDQFVAAGLLPARREAAGPFSWVQMRPRFFDAFHRCLAAIAAAGNNLIIDHVIEFEEWFALIVDLLAPYDVFLVGVHCPPSELARRERERGDRYLGEGLEHLLEGVHAHVIYDLELDTSRHSPTDGARLIASAWAKRARPGAWDRMVAQRV